MRPRTKTGRVRTGTGHARPLAFEGLFVLATFVLAWSSARAEPLRIQHSAPPGGTAWQPLGIEATLAGDTSPERVATLDAVVVTADGDLRPVPLALSRNAAFGEIPAALVAPPTVSYYIRLIDAEGTVVTVPPGAPESGVFRVPITPPPAETVEAEAEGISASVEILAPAPGEVVKTSRPQIAGLIDPPLEDPWEALLLLDGRDRTGAAELGPGYFVLSVSDSLAVGAHRATYSAVGAAGPVEASWVFFVRERTAPVEVREAPRPGAARAPASTGWNVVGRLEVGWAVASAETTAVESLDVFLPYDEVSRPTLDLYASGLNGSRSFTLTAQYNPVYDDELDWSAAVRTARIEVEGGSIYPSFSPTTLDWAAGLGARAAVRLGGATTEFVAMRMSESDTLAGFGIYSRFAVGAKETFDWHGAVSASIAYVSVFDREESIPEEQRLTDPLRNGVAAGLARARRGPLVGEVELARSSAEGEIEGDGTAFRGRLELRRDLDNRVSIEYTTCEPEFYSAGSFEFEPGESAIEVEYAYRPGETLRASGWTRVGRTTGPQSTIAEDELEIKVYARADLSWPLGRGETRTYLIGRYDRTPYDAYDYEYTYGALGGTWRRGATRVLASVSWSRSESPEATDTWSVVADIRREIVAERWRVRAAGRWAFATGRETDSTRSHYTIESRWDLGSVDLTAEYWLVEKDDRADPAQTYTEHVGILSLGRAF